MIFNSSSHVHDAGRVQVKSVTKQIYVFATRITAENTETAHRHQAEHSAWTHVVQKLFLVIKFDDCKE